MAASDNLRLQVILQAIDRATAPLRRIRAASGDTARALKESRDKLKELDRAQSEMRGFRLAAVEIRRNERSLRELTAKSAGYRAELERHRETHSAVQAKVKVAVSEHGKLARALLAGKTSGEQFNQAFNASRIRLEAAQRAAGRSSSSLKFLSERARTAQAAITALSAQQEAAKQRLTGYKERLDTAGIGTDNLARKTRSLRTSQEQLKSTLEAQRAQLSAVHASEQRLAGLRQRHGKAMAHTGMVAAGGYGALAGGTRVAKTVLSPVKPFMAHEDAMLGIARQVPGARDELGTLTPVYRDIERQVRELSQEMPIATTEIARMFTAAARMEVPTEQLKGFTREAGMMAIAFDAAADEITDSMGKVAKNFKIPLDKIGGLGDTINYLDDNAISKGSDIIDYLNRTSGVVSTVAMSEKDAAALGSTLLTLGERTETAGTATNAIVQKFAAATKGTKKFKSAFAEIGLSTKEIQEGMAKDATGTLMKVLDAVRKVPEDKRIGVMVELVGLEHSDTLAKLADKPEELRRQLALANGKDAVGSMGREFAARKDTTSAQLQMAENRAFNASAQAGETLKPALLQLLNIVNPLLERFAAWIQANPRLAAGILKAVAGLALLVAAVGAVTMTLALIVGKVMLTQFLFARFALGGVMPLVKILRSGLVGALRMLLTVFTTVGRALLMNPIGLAITGIALLAIVLYTYWGPIKEWFLELWNSISAKVIGTWNTVEEAIDEAWQKISDGAQALWTDIKAAFNAGIEWLAALPVRFLSLGGDIIRGLADGITGALGFVKDAITGAADASLQWFKERLGINSPSRVFMLAGGEISAGAALGIAGGSNDVRHAALGMVAAASVALASPAFAAQQQVIAPIVAASASAKAGRSDAIGDGTLRIDRRPPLAAPAAAGMPAAAGDTHNYNTFTINAAPGMDPAAIARAVAAELDRRERQGRSRRLSRLGDID